MTTSQAGPDALVGVEGVGEIKCPRKIISHRDYIRSRCWAKFVEDDTKITEFDVEVIEETGRKHPKSCNQKRESRTE